MLRFVACTLLPIKRHFAMTLNPSRKIEEILIVVDVPNMNWMLRDVVGTDKPSNDQLIQYEILKKYFEALYSSATVTATAFVNARENNWSSMLGWAKGLKDSGWNVFVKPKLEKTDIDEAIVEHIQMHCDNPALDLKTVVVVSHDTKRFSSLLESIAGTGVRAMYVAFTELLSPKPGLGVEVLDIRDIPNITATPLPDELRYEKLPLEGRYI